MKRIFLAGASGAIGRRLVPLLLADGHVVIGSTRFAEKARGLEQAGVEPVIVDMFDRDAVIRAIETVRPEILIHQLTDLPQVFDAAAMEAARARNARLREVTAPILAEAAAMSGVRRVVIQSIAFAYAEGRRPHVESDPVDVPSVAAMERTFLQNPAFETVILRYGRLWGPGTWTPAPAEAPTVHVDAAAHAARLAATQGSPGVYHIAEENAVVSTTRAGVLGFTPDFRIPVSPT